MKPVGCCGGEPLSQAYGLPAQHKARPSGALKGSLIYKLANAIKIKLPIYTGKHLNINITDTGKGNNRRWQATDGQREQRANSAGRFRHGSPRKYTSRVNPSTSLQNAVKNKVHRLHRKAPEYQHYRYRQGQPPALASHRRTARATSEFRRTVSTRQPAQRASGDFVRHLPANFLSGYSAISAPASHTMCADW